MTNSAFTYDPATNIIHVNPGDEPEQDGEMIITWKTRKVPLIRSHVQEDQASLGPPARWFTILHSRVMADLSSMQLPENITPRSKAGRSGKTRIHICRLV